MNTALNNTTLRSARLLSVAFAALLTLGTLASVGHLATSAEASAQWAHAAEVSATSQG